MEKSNRKNTSGSLWVLLFILMGTGGYLRCSLSHWCMGGHLHHVLYMKYEIASDVAWRLFFIAAIVSALKLNITHKIAVLCLILFAATIGPALAPIDWGLLAILYVLLITNIQYDSKANKKHFIYEHEPEIKTEEEGDAHNAKDAQI